MRKVKELQTKNSHSFIVFCIFNPFAKRDVAEYAEYVELIPRIGISIHKTRRQCSVFVAWLNSYISLTVFKIIRRCVKL